uniref:Cadherin domain-containing protein n=1 Tax=Amphiprion ocellaris TaxID=80972 RepID=A0A3Q1ALT4_AMPOC
MAPLLKCSLFILLTSLPNLVPVGAEWIIAPRQLKENHDYTGLAFIARIRSDKENHTRITYSLSGPGVDQPPVGQFGVDPHTGYVKIFTTLDREKIPFYTLTGIAKYHDGTRAEKDIDLKITVLDENDNPPVIVAQQVGYVEESSATGTVVMKVIATDADQENTINSKIFYRIKEESNRAGIFFINCHTGEIIVQKSALDREVSHSYKLVIEASDFNGLPGGNSGSGEIEIQIKDINDNIPTLEKESYEGSIEENTINVEVMRIKAIDLDLIHTDNWLAAYKIISGNEGGYFSITTDAKTNEGIIMINKALDYEELKVLNLQIAVANKAEYNFGTGGIARPIPDKSYPIKINVVNQKEGPRFQPTTKVVTISEDRTAISLYKVIANYAAIDSDTLKIATNVRYAKIRDDDNWLIIDEKTGDIKLNKFPDRESKFLINGTYYSKIVCITNESPSKTATGTIAIQVEDFNDDCPKLISTTPTMCLEDKVIYATAVDEDEFPNSVPFDFTVIQDKSEGKWTVEHLNETTAILRDHANLWPGIYKVAVEIKDQQGVSCDTVQMIDVTVCTCQENTRACVSRRKTTARFGAKSNHAAQHSHQMDGLLVYDYEGQGSPAGSVGCCSLLENDNDLSFLNDLGPKFKTLAEICQGSTVVTESVDTRVSFPPVRPVSPVRPSTSTHTHVHTHSETIRDRDHVNTVNTSNLASGSSTFIHEERITERAQGAASVPTVHVQDNVVIPSQTLLVQQPAMYYAATPMYVVESKPQVMLVAGGTQQAVASVGQVGMSHGLMQVGGLQGSQGVVLVDRQVGVGGATSQAAQGTPKGTLSRSRQVLVVENKSSTGGEHDADLAQGFIQTGQSSAEQGFEVRSHGLQVKTQSFSQSSHSSAGSHEDLLLTATPKLQGSQRVVVQHKKVSVTERNVV